MSDSVPPLRREVDWQIAEVALNWQCPKCGQWIPEGNPLYCPHLAYGELNVVYSPSIDGPVGGLPKLLRRIGYEHLADELEGNHHHEVR